jgi:3-phenylpropionate/cinnamic acid dioxygenase small subunit
MSDEWGVMTALARYCHTCDDGRWDEFGALFTEDAVLWIGEEATVGRDAIRTAIASIQTPERRGLHTTSNIDLTVEGDTAHAVSNFVFYRWRTDGAAIPAILGRYVDDLRFEDGAWRFTVRRIVFAGPAPR